MKYFLLFSALTVFTFNAYTQNFQVPENYTLEAKEDYAQYEQDVIDAVNWLINTPVNKERSKRKATNVFLLKWLTGSPNVTITVHSYVVDVKNCDDCFMIFMGGWAKYALESKDFKNELKGNLAGIESMILFYNNNRDILGKNKVIEKYKKLQEKGELEAHLEKKIKA